MPRHSGGEKFDLPRGSILAVDRGYNDYEWFNSLNEKGIFFLTRLRRMPNTQL